jgi:HAD superfamily hydrolase (TIGR01549 family)
VGIRGVVFDLDGTLVSLELDFELIRREIGLPAGTPILEALERLTPEDQRSAREILDRHEQQAVERASLHCGVAEFLAWLDTVGVRRGIFSRNSRRSVEAVLRRLGLVFDTIVAREDGPYKPHPHGLWQICEAWQVTPAEVVMIGDYLFDLQAGRAAGTHTALITHGREWPFAQLADITFSSFTDLPAGLDGWFSHPR